MRIKVLTFILSILLAFVCGCSKKEKIEILPVPEVSCDFEMSVLKVGQADAIILHTETHTAIIDCGEKDDGDEVVEYLENKGVKTVDYLFITHFDKDHVGGASEVIKNVNVKKILVPDYKGEGDEYRKYLSAVEDTDAEPQIVTEMICFTMDDVLFEVYPPERKSYAEGDNDFSLALSITHGKNRFLFTGDAEEVRLREIMSQTEGTYDFLKVPHHGKYNNTTSKFIEKVKPEYAVITCSDKNPAEERTVTELESIGCDVYTTNYGDITVTSDGKNIMVNQ